MVLLRKWFFALANTQSLYLHIRFYEKNEKNHLDRSIKAHWLLHHQTQDDANKKASLSSHEIIKKMTLLFRMGLRWVIACRQYLYYEQYTTKYIWKIIKKKFFTLGKYERCQLLGMYRGPFAILKYQMKSQISESIEFSDKSIQAELISICYIYWSCFITVTQFFTYNSNFICFFCVTGVLGTIESQ